MQKQPKAILAQCKCGYTFLATSIRSRKFASYAVVRDKDYQRFLKAEVRVLQAPAELEAKLRAIGKSSKLVGSLLECPDCARLLLWTPGGGSKAYYSRED